MSGDFETLEINQPKIKYLKPEDNTEWLDKLINNIEDMKNKISKESQKFKKETFYLIFSLVEKQFKKEFKFCILGNRFFVNIIQNKGPTIFLCKKIQMKILMKKELKIQKKENLI